MPLTIPTSFPAPPAANTRVIDQASGSTQERFVTSPPVICYYDSVTDACATIATAGNRRSITINDLTACSKQFRASHSTKSFTSPDAGLTPALLADYIDVVLDWYIPLTDSAILSGANPDYTSTSPNGFIFANGQHSLRIAGAVADTIVDMSVSIPVLTSSSICTTPDPNNPVCTLSKLYRSGVSISAIATLLTNCVKVSAGSASFKYTLAGGIYESGDMEILSAHLNPGWRTA